MNLFTTLINWLKGKKTYFVSVLGMITAFFAHLHFGFSLTALIETIYAAIATMTLRAGIAKTTGK